MKKLLFSRITLSICLILSILTILILALTLTHYRKEKKSICLNLSSLQKKLESPAPEWMRERIQKDLALFSEQGISSQLLDETFHGKRIQDFSLVRFRITDRVLTFSIDDSLLDSRHFRHLLEAMKKLNESTLLPDVDFIISLKDGFDVNPQGFPLSPCFVFAKSDSVANFILMPDFKALGGYGKLRQQILDGNKSSDWAAKQPKAFWRGSTTSGFFTANNWDTFCRGKLVLQSLLHPELLDARFTSVVQCTPDVPALMKAQGLVASSIDKVDHLRYKYLIDVDGNSCTYERCFWLLLSNSVLLKQITPNIQWYYGGLKPYVHFIPIKEDLSDLFQQLEWARTHDEESKKMADQSTEFVKEHLSSESIFQYMALLLSEYAKLQKRPGRTPALN